ncbi:MAG: 4-hydroxymandelate oxidase [Alphaproteobacteria bacterium]|jgi:4-hydroxymandelate oxidase
MRKDEELAISTRRAFLSFLAASPVMLAASRVSGQPMVDLSDIYAPEILNRAQDAINVFDFQETAKHVFNPGHYTRMMMGGDNGETVRANREGFSKIQLRIPRLINTQNIDTSVELFGETYPVPIFIAPCGGQRAFHEEGEIAVARAARSRGVGQFLSTVASSAIEDVNAARGAPVLFQLYPDLDFSVTEAVIRRAERAGCQTMTVTVDHPASNREAIQRFRRDSNAECQACHSEEAGYVDRTPMFEGLVRSNARRTFLDWDYIDRIRDATSMHLMLKGIVTGPDAARAIDHGIEGIIVSNHGGRADNSLRGTIESLPEVVAAVQGRIPVLIDSGFRRGGDIFKALALGADAIAVGRPYLWGLGTFGQEGVETVLDILTREFEVVMRQAGTVNLGQINGRYIV